MAEQYNTQEELLIAITSKLGEETANLVNAELDAVNAKIDDIKSLSEADIEDLVSKIATISNVLDGDTDGEFSTENIIGAIAKNADDVQAINALVSSFSEKVSGLEASVADLNAKLASVEGTSADSVVALSSSVSGLESKVSESENIISGIQTDIDSVKGSLLKIDDSAVDAGSLFSSAKVDSISKDLSAQIAGKTEISDTTIDTNATYSSTKIENLLGDASKVYDTKITDAVSEAKSEAIDEAVASVKQDVLTADIDAIIGAFTLGFKGTSSSTVTTDSGDGATL